MSVPIGEHVVAALVKRLGGDSIKLTSTELYTAGELEVHVTDFDEVILSLKEPTLVGEVVVERGELDAGPSIQE